MKFGIKLWSTNIDLIDQAKQTIDKKIFDYIELFIVPGTSISPFMIDVPYIIHIPHYKFGINIGDPLKKEYNVNIINECISWADKLDAEYLILHAEHGSMKSAKDVLYEVADSRLLIENMPKVGLNGEQMIGYLPEQIEELIDSFDIGLCLDLGHAIKASISLCVDYKEFIQRFLIFNPMIFHVCDGNFNTERDDHLNIESGTYDFKYFRKCICNNNSKLVTLETPRVNQLSIEEDIKNLGLLQSLWT